MLITQPHLSFLPLNSNIIIISNPMLTTRIRYEEKTNNYDRNLNFFLITFNGERRIFKKVGEGIKNSKE
jgi:hypothetical protein